MYTGNYIASIFTCACVYIVLKSIQMTDDT